MLLHGKVLEIFKKEIMLKMNVEEKDIKVNMGMLGTLIDDCDSMFFSIAFPHGNRIQINKKIKFYQEVKTYLELQK